MGTREIRQAQVEACRAGQAGKARKVRRPGGSRLADSTRRPGEPATWGSGQQKMQLFEGDMGSIQREIRSSMQREDKPAMETEFERIAAKARSEPKLRFTSLAHHITQERVWKNLCRSPKRSAPGVDGQTVTEAKESFREWVEPMLQSVHRRGYRAPDIRRVHPQTRQAEKRPLGVPCVSDRALQRSAAQVLSAIYEADFLPCSFGGRPGRGAHHALATLMRRSLAARWLGCWRRT